MRLVSDSQDTHEPTDRLLALARKLELKAGELDRHATRSESETTVKDLRSAADLSRMLAANIMAQVARIRSQEPSQ